ncbi:cytochrome c oxidase subunit II [Arenicellales bacterium nBUS_48]
MIVSRFKKLRSAIVATAGVGMMGILPTVAQAEWALNLQRPVTEIARVQYDLHMLIMYIVTVIGIIVFGVMFYSIAKFRKSKGAEAAKFSHSTKAEVLWTVIPTLILIAMAVPSTKALLLMEDTTESDMVLKVTGYQWGWQYDYLEEDVSFFSKLATPQSQITGNETKGENYLLEVDNHVVIPAGKKVRLLLTAKDVIHAWWVPQLGGKKDAIPGFINEMWIRADETGTYRGQCAELCGKDHGYMPIVVDVVEEAEYMAWIEAQKNKS